MSARERSEQCSVYRAIIAHCDSTTLCKPEDLQRHIEAIRSLASTQLARTMADRDRIIAVAESQRLLDAFKAEMIADGRVVVAFPRQEV